MHRGLVVILFLFLSAVPALFGAEAWPMRTIALDDLTRKGLHAYAIEDGTATINSKVVRRIDFPKTIERYGKGTVSLRNKTNFSVRPRVTIRVMNRYGFRIGYGTITWGFQELKPGATENEDAIYYSIVEICGDACPYRDPGDLNEPAFVIVDDES